MLDLNETSFSKLIRETNKIFEDCGPKEKPKDASSVKKQCKYKTQSAAQQFSKARLRLAPNTKNYVLNGYNHDKIVITDEHGTIKSILGTSANIIEEVKLIVAHDEVMQLMEEIQKEEEETLNKAED